MIPLGHPLEGAGLKLDRAGRQAELDRAIAEFLEREPYNISSEQRPDGGEHDYRVQVHIREERPLGIIVGDCLQS